MTPADLPTSWRTKAADLERFAPPAAEAFRSAADELDAALIEAADATLTLAEASQESGFSPRRLRELLSDGTIPQAGRKGSPRIKRADLPRKARSTPAASSYDAGADARQLMAKLR